MDAVTVHSLAVAETVVVAAAELNDTDFYEYDLECLLNNALYGKHLSDTNFLTLLICLSILNN